MYSFAMLKKGQWLNNFFMVGNKNWNHYLKEFDREKKRDGNDGTCVAKF